MHARRSGAAVYGTLRQSTWRPDRVQVIRDFPQSSTLSPLRTFLGLVNFYHRFIPKCATILTPLNARLKTTATNSRALQWTLPATTAFNDIKEVLANATLLVHPKPNALLNVMTDASDVAIGAVLQQFLGDKWYPLSYFSRKLSPTEQRYSTFDREPLAVYCAIRHFLEAREFHILTDHKLLTHSLQSKPDWHSPHQIRHLDFISQFTCGIRHVAGEGNPVADALSYLETNAVQLGSAPPTVDFCAMAKAQPDATDLQHLHSTNNTLKLTRVSIPMCAVTLLCDTSTGTPCLYVPEQFRHTVFNSIHWLSHLGVRATLRLIKSCYFWPGMNANVRR